MKTILLSLFLVCSVSSEKKVPDVLEDVQQSISLYPPVLDFGFSAVGRAKSKLVTLINKHSKKSVQLNKISGKTLDFYSSFFEDKIVPGGGNTTFNVIFLPRSFGEVKTNLLIHTSFGDVKLPIKGQGKECPYRLRPSLVGIKAPLNATITPEIVMYNPHSTPIQILEIYSSGGQFQLELPSGGQEGPQALWEIPPYTSKPIIRIRFHGAQVGNHTAYIRIKISKWSEAEDPDRDAGQRLSGSREENILVVPVEFEILSSYGIYSRMPIIDFGITTTNDEAKMIRLNLLNSGNENIDIIDLKLKNVAGLIELQRSDLTLILNSKQATENLIINGEVVIKTQKKKFITEYMELSVGIQAEIFKGSLDFAGNTTVFITGAKNYTRTKREFFAKNSFNVPLSISNLAIERNDTTVFNLTDFRPVILKPNAKIVLFSISAVNETANFKSHLTIETNITSYKLSIVICTGLLTRYTSLESAKFSPLSEDSVLDFGSIPSGDFSNFGFILMKNLNPIPIQLQKWNFSNPSGVFFNSMFLGCASIASVLENGNSAENRNDDKGNNSHASNTGNDDDNSNNVNINDSRFKFYFTLSPDNFGAFELSVQAYAIKAFTAVFTIWTEIEEIVTSVKFVTVMGRLEIDSSKLHFKECFPGRRCSADILIHSTFLKTMRVKAITVSVPGLIFEYNTVSPNGLPEIIANQDTAIGKIHFDPTSVCGKNCYVGRDDQLSNTNNNKKSVEFDKTELRERAENFRRLKWNLQSITFTLETTEVRRFEFNASVDVVWPKLVKGIQTLPPVEVGQNYDAMILLRNPSNHNLNVDIYLSDPKEAKATNLSLPLEVVDICMFCYLTDRKVFLLNGKPSDYHYTNKMKPNSIIKIPVRFIGKEAGTFSTLMHIRNNLTLYEAVWITAKAVQPQFRFGNRKPGSNTPLLFEINEKHLTSCDKTKPDDDTPVLVSSKRTFTARNMGEIPIFIKKFYIGDEECEGYGFKILDCSSFELKGNSSKKIDIAFTPDFTMTRISQSLYLKTNLSYSNFNYTLLATVPASCLEQCTKALMRPFWEMYMKMMSVGVLAVAFIFVLISAFLDSDKVLKDHVQNMSKEKGPIQPPLDLRRIVGLSKSDSVQDNGSGSNSTDKNNVKSNGTSLSKKRNAKRNTISNVAPIANSNNNNNSNHKNKLWGEDFTKKINSTLKLANNLTTLTNRSSNSQSNDHSSHQNRINQTFSQRSVKEEKPQKKTPSKDFTDHANSETAERFELLEKMSDDVTQKKNNSRLDGSSLDAKKTKLTLRKTKSLQTTTCDSSSHLNAAKDEMNLIATMEKTQDKMSKLKYQREKSEQPIIDKKNLSSNASELSFSSSQSNESCSKNTLENKSLKLANGLRKYGKTPGRERKKETNQSTKRLERKAPKFKGTAFQFSSPIVDDTKTTISPSANSSIWDQSQASFSNIVAQTINSSDQLIQDIHNINNNEIYQNSSAENCGNLQHDWNEADLKNHETFGLDDVTKLPDLGPIGTKKSPSSTPIWEPLPNSIHRPIANTSFSSMSANSSFFSNSFPTRPCLEYANDNQYLGGASGLLDHLVLDSQQQQSQPNPQHLQHPQQNWQTNDFLLCLLQQRDQRNASATRQHIDWPTNRPVWAPVAFPETPNTNLNIWPNSSVRPPPGLGITRKESPIRNQQPVHTQPQNLLHSQPNKEQNNEIDEIPTFDPFSSLSSIWSDSWNNSNANNNKKQ